MLLLPPSETKTAGGAVASETWLERLSFAQLNEARSQVITALIGLSSEPVAVKRLGLTAKTSNLLQANLELRDPLLMPAYLRYSGVVFDALNDRGLKGSETENNNLEPEQILQKNVFVQSALLGLVAITDQIPNYRLSATHRLPGIPKNTWQLAHQAVFGSTSGIIVDARSNAYADLAPLPRKTNHYRVTVVTSDATGARRALNHFNKKAKGRFARAWLTSEDEVREPEQLLQLAKIAGLDAELVDQTLVLVD
jgi:cytoplasmic iron level regulating protein YaaA (DUF328/UPF0246 family)